MMADGHTSPIRSCSAPRSCSVRREIFSASNSPRYLLFPFLCSKNIAAWFSVDWFGESEVSGISCLMFSRRDSAEGGRFLGVIIDRIMISGERSVISAWTIRRKSITCIGISEGSTIDRNISSLIVVREGYRRTATDRALLASVTWLYIFNPIWSGDMPELVFAHSPPVLPLSLRLASIAKASSSFKGTSKSFAVFRLIYPSTSCALSFQT